MTDEAKPAAVTASEPSWSVERARAKLPSPNRRLRARARAPRPPAWRGASASKHPLVQRQVVGGHVGPVPPQRQLAPASAHPRGTFPIVQQPEHPLRNGDMVRLRRQQAVLALPDGVLRPAIAGAD